MSPKNPAARPGAHSDAPGAPVSSLPSPLPRRRLLAALARLERLRDAAEDLATSLIARLDAVDGDPDLEDGADREPDPDAEDDCRDLICDWPSGDVDQRPRWPGVAAAPAGRA